jgi:hypothetical protein
VGIRHVRPVAVLWARNGRPPGHRRAARRHRGRRSLKSA